MLTRTATKTNKTHVVVTVGENVVKDEEETTVESYRVIQKVLAVDEAGQAKQSLIYVAGWSHKKGEEEAEVGLEGVHVEVTGVGKDRTWAIRTPGKEPSETAKKWLDDTWGKEEHDADRAMEPQKELAIGESWTPDMTAMAASMAEHFEVDLEKSKASGTLTGVEQGMASFQLDFAFQTKGLAMGPGQVAPWKEGGVLAFKGTGRHTLAPTGEAGGGKITFTLSGVAEADGATVKLDVSGTQDGENKAGGEMPPVPDAVK